MNMTELQPFESSTFQMKRPVNSFQDQKLQSVEDDGKNAYLEDQGTKNDQNGESGQIAQNTKNVQNFAVMAMTFAYLNFMLYMLWSILHCQFNKSLVVLNQSRFTGFTNFVEFRHA